jgi:hypothetical protein
MTDSQLDRLEGLFAQFSESVDRLEGVARTLTDAGGTMESAASTVTAAVERFGRSAREIPTYIQVSR